MIQSGASIKQENIKEESGTGFGDTTSGDYKMETDDSGISLDSLGSSSIPVVAPPKAPIAKKGYRIILVERLTIFVKGLILPFVIMCR